MSKVDFTSLIEEAEKSHEYKVEKLSMSFLIPIWKLMDEQNITQRELSQKTGLKESYISKIFTRKGNLTLSTIAKLFDALNGEVQIKVKQKENEETLKKAKADIIEMFTPKSSTKNKNSFENANVWTYYTFFKLNRVYWLEEQKAKSC